MPGGSEKKREQRYKKRYKKRGSFTVEAAVVVPVCLMVLFFVLQTLFYVHHVSWYTATAWECALSQMQKGPDTVTADACWQKIGRQQPLPVSGVCEKSFTADGKVKVVVSGKVFSVYGLPAMEFEITAGRKYTDPTGQLRQSRLAEQLLNTQKE